MSSGCGVGVTMMGLNCSGLSNNIITVIRKGLLVGQSERGVEV